MPNQFDFPDAWTRYVPLDEPPEITAIWDAAAVAMEAARVAEEVHGKKRARNVSLRVVYLHLKDLRARGVPAGNASNARHGIPSSKLVLLGEHWERKSRERGRKVS